MSIKKKLGMGIATAVLGVGLVGGGTFAYFSDTAEANGTFASGNLDLNVNPTEVINIDNLKPGDWMPRTFKLENNGSLDISKVLLETKYTDNVEGHDFGKSIMVNIMKNKDKNGAFNHSNIITKKTLHELKNMDPDAVARFSRSFIGEKSGLEAGDTDELYVVFEFVDNGEDQNHLQDANLELKWTFNAEQTKGERK